MCVLLHLVMLTIIIIEAFELRKIDEHPLNAGIQKGTVVKPSKVIIQQVPTRGKDYGGG